MLYRVHLREVATGRTAIVDDERNAWNGFTPEKARIAKEDDTARFHWSEGNYACDCNRRLFLTNWKERVEPECGEGGIVCEGIYRDDIKIWDGDA